MPRTNPKLLERTRQMRSEMTQPERELWTALRAKRPPVSSPCSQPVCR
jgi:very-short-patch-repair endonuclease